MIEPTKALDGFEDALTQEALAICRIPSPTFGEARRADYIAGRLAALGASDIERDELHDVTARLPGTGGGPTILAVAHIDTVFPEGTDVEPRWDGRYWRAPGIRDNSASVAITLLLPEMLRRCGATLAGDLILAFSVGEEGLGNLRGIRAIMERFKNEVAVVVAVDGNLGIVHNVGISVRRLEVVVEAEGGHSWADAGRPSAVHSLTRIAARIGDIVVPQSPKSVLNIGTIAGGTSVNAIAQSARFTLDIRSVDHPVVVALEAQVRDIVASVAGTDGVRATIDVIGDRPGGGIAPDHPLVAAIVGGYASVGVEPRLSPASTDANIPLSLHIPAASMGVSSGGNTHTLKEYLDPASLPVGAAALLHTLRALQTATLS